MNGLFVGYEPLFHVPSNLPVPGFFDYGLYVLLGIAAGAVGALLPAVFYRVRDLFLLVPVPFHFKPVIGGLSLGLIALWIPQILGSG